MEQVLLVVQVILAIGLIGMVLIQRSDSDGFGLSGGSGSNLMSGRSAASAMTRITAIFAALFILNSLALSILAARGHTSSIAETIEQQQSGVPVVPVEGETKVEKNEATPADETTAPSVPAADADAPKPAKKRTKKTVDVDSSADEANE